MIETETLLEKCPHCGAWPMAVQLQRSPGQPQVRFRCANCGHQEFGRLVRGAGVRPHSRPLEQAGREARHHG